MDKIKFQNKQYLIREIELPELGNIFISTINLNNVLMNNESNYVSEEARIIDERLYFFVEESEIKLKESKLVELLISQTA